MTYVLVAVRISEDPNRHQVDLYDLENGRAQFDASAPFVGAELQIDNLSAYSGLERANTALQRQAHRFGPAQLPTPRTIAGATNVLRQVAAVLQRMCHAVVLEAVDEDGNDTGHLAFGSVVGEDLIGAAAEAELEWSKPRKWADLEVGQPAKIVHSDLVGHIRSISLIADPRIVTIGYTLEGKEHTEEVSRLAELEISRGD